MWPRGGSSPATQLPLAQFWRRGWGNSWPFLALRGPAHTVIQDHAESGGQLSDPSLTPCPSTYCYPFPFLLPSQSFLLCLIKKHLLSIHCISEKNLYFRHAETRIRHLNTNGGRCSHYFIPFYLSIITPSRIQYADRCKRLIETQSPKNNGKKLDSLVLIKSCFGRVGFQAKGAAEVLLFHNPPLSFCILGKQQQQKQNKKKKPTPQNPKLPLLDFLILASIQSCFWKDWEK